MVENWRAIFKNGSYYCTVEVDNVFAAHAGSLKKDQKIHTLICFFDSLIHVNVPLEIVRQRNS